MLLDSEMLIETRVFAGKLKDKALLYRSSSGGAFIAISNVFLNQGNAVVCAIYNYDTYQTEFNLVLSNKHRDCARGSKYMQSKPGKVFKEAVTWLKNNPEKKLLFLGMGCQAEGFRKYAEVVGIRNRVWVVDIICHGSPSPKLWKDYAKMLEIKNGGKLSELSFKDKRKGWKSPTAKAVINEKEVSLKDYVTVFYSRCALRPSCHECPFAAIERKTDITIGDFWHIEDKLPDFYDEMGISLLLIHTKKGLELFDTFKEDMECCESNTTDCWQENLEQPTPVSEKRAEFWNDYQQKGIDYIMKKYGTVSLKTRLKYKFLEIMCVWKEGKK